MKRITLSLLLFLCIITIGKAQEIDEQVLFPELKGMIEDLRKQYVPDKRVSIFEITVSENSKDIPVLLGKVSNIDAYNKLLVEAEKHYPNLVDSVKTLPAVELGENTWGIINVSVADIRVAPRFSAEMATQALMGTPIKIYETVGKWSRIQTPDGYIAWVENIAFTKHSDKDRIQHFLNDKIIFTDYYGFAYSEPNDKSQHVSDLVAGNLLSIKIEDSGAIYKGDYYKVEYPDKRVAYVKKSQSKYFMDWEKDLNIEPQTILTYAKTLMGIPYVWGGTSSKGIDCSGFTKTVYFMNGVIIPRDASQQALVGERVEIETSFDLQPGDLMFFGKKGENGEKDRVRHVGFYLGNKEFIHASGYVRINSLDPSQPHYDEVNTREFISARRITKNVVKNKEGVSKIVFNPFYMVLFSSAAR